MKSSKAMIFAVMSAIFAIAIVSPGAHPLIMKLKDSEYEIAPSSNGCFVREEDF